MSEQIREPVRHIMGGRSLALLFNARAWRIITERTGFNWLKEQSEAVDSALDADSPEERNAKFGALLGVKLRILLADSLNLPIVFYAVTQNEDNGRKPTDPTGRGTTEQRPTWDWIEDEMVFDAEVMKAIMAAFMASHGGGNAEPEKAARGNGLPEASANPAPAPPVI